MIVISEDALGKETIIDLHECDVSTFTRESLENFCVELCKEIDMTPVQRYLWEYKNEGNKPAEESAHYVGYSVCQFILTSDIMIHSWDNLKKISLNIFSCKDFNEDEAVDFCRGWFKSKSVRQSVTLLRY
jgi:S-adenosylmethionine/arginine decarboxylase-like enzyme